MDSLSSLHIEDRDEQKYSTKCPKCSDKRTKSGTKSLMVYKDPDGTRVECMHPGCEWYQNRQFIVGRPQRQGAPRSTEYELPIRTIDTLPTIVTDNTYYTYKDPNGEVLFYIVRKDLGEGKKTFYPVARTTGGEWVMRRPSVKCLYGAERLDNHLPVIVVEGEKAKDAAQKIFTTAVVVTWPGGASSANMGDWELLKDREVTLWPDNDEAGRKVMEQIANQIDGDVYMVDVSSLERKQDLADNLTTEQIKDIWATREPYKKILVTGAYEADTLFQAMENTALGAPLGWDNMKNINYPASGLVIVEGRSGHGKTTLMANMMAKLIKKKDGPVVFYSYEMPARRIILKLVSILDGRELDEKPHLNEEKYREEILAGENEVYKELVARLGKDIFITDSYLDINSLLSDLRSPTMRGATIFLDYLQYIPSPSDFKNRYLTLKEFSDNIQNIAHKNNLVVVAGAQLTPGDKPRMDSPRESKDIHNVAELVLRVWNKRQGENMGVTWKEVDELPGDIMIEVRKNRNGFSGSMYMFNFKHGSRLEPIMWEV